jgi:hypothetical protein
VTKSFDITFVVYRVTQEIVVTITGKRLDLTKDGVVDDNAVHAGVVVRIPQGAFDVNGVVQFT